jgi:DNA-directed RNA polymerase specialized sigma24 family protein
VGDETQLAELLDRHRPFLHQMVRREARRKNLPAACVAAVIDHVEEVACQQWRDGPGRDVPDGKWPGWLTEIARNELLNEQRRVVKGRYGEQALPDDLVDPRSLSDEQFLAPIERSAAIDAITELGEPEYSLMYLTVVEGMRSCDAAAKLGMDPTVAARTVRNLEAKVRTICDGGSVKGQKAKGIIAFARKVKALRDQGDSRD